MDVLRASHRRMEVGRHLLAAQRDRSAPYSDEQREPPNGLSRHASGAEQLARGIECASQIQAHAEVSAGADVPRYGVRRDVAGGDVLQWPAAQRRLDRLHRLW